MLILLPGGKWDDTIINGDEIWRQVKQALEDTGAKLPALSRRPDVRLIVDNESDAAFTFNNPGDHSGGKVENIPNEGDKTAVMIMPAGDTLQEQFRNAKTLDAIFKTSERGITPQLVEFIDSGNAETLIEEAYGPAPFDKQSERLTDLRWPEFGGRILSLNPTFGESASYGARPPTAEIAFLVDVPIHLKGTETTPELLESEGVVVAVAQDWETKQESTRPIVPSVARSYYGDSYDNIPSIAATADGIVTSIHLPDQLIVLDPEGGPAVSYPVTQPEQTDENVYILN